MTRKTLARILIIVALLTVAAVPAFAQEEVIVAGTGTLTAEGDGRVALHMVGEFSATLDGKLKIIDRDGDADINVTGDGLLIIRTRGDATVYIYRGFNGSAQVSGGDFTARLIGANISLTATGTGIAKLWGEGTYSTSGGASGSWATFPAARVPLGQ